MKKFVPLVLVLCFGFIISCTNIFTKEDKTGSVNVEIPAYVMQKIAGAREVVESGDGEDGDKYTARVKLITVGDYEYSEVLDWSEYEDQPESITSVIKDVPVGSKIKVGLQLWLVWDDDEEQLYYESYSKEFTVVAGENEASIVLKFSIIGEFAVALYDSSFDEEFYSAVKYDSNGYMLVFETDDGEPADSSLYDSITVKLNGKELSCFEYDTEVYPSVFKLKIDDCNDIGEENTIEYTIKDGEFSYYDTDTFTIYEEPFELSFELSDNAGIKYPGGEILYDTNGYWIYLSATKDGQTVGINSDNCDYINWYVNGDSKNGSSLSKFLYLTNGECGFDESSNSKLVEVTCEVHTKIGLTISKSFTFYIKEWPYVLNFNFTSADGETDFADADKVLYNADGYKFAIDFNHIEDNSGNTYSSEKAAFDEFVWSVNGKSPDFLAGTDSGTTDGSDTTGTTDTADTSDGSVFYLLPEHFDSFLDADSNAEITISCTATSSTNPMSKGTGSITFQIGMVAPVSVEYDSYVMLWDVDYAAHTGQSEHNVYVGNSLDSLTLSELGKIETTAQHPPLVDVDTNLSEVKILGQYGYYDIGEKLEYNYGVDNTSSGFIDVEGKTRVPCPSEVTNGIERFAMNSKYLAIYYSVPGDGDTEAQCKLGFYSIEDNNTTTLITTLEVTSNLKDMMIIDNVLYCLYSEFSSETTSSTQRAGETENVATLNQYGWLEAYNLSKPDTNSTNKIGYCNDFQIVDNVAEYSNQSSIFTANVTGNVTGLESVFYAPQKFVAIKEDELYIADTGLIFKEKEYDEEDDKKTGTYKQAEQKNRVVKVNLKEFAISGVEDNPKITVKNSEGNEVDLLFKFANIEYLDTTTGYLEF